MLNKAKSSWAIADSFVEDDELLNIAANRYYYALFQAAFWRNGKLSSPLIRKQNKDKKYTESSHVFVRRIVSEIVGGDSARLRIFRKFKTLRIQADYKPADVKRCELREALISQAHDLFDDLLGDK